MNKALEEYLDKLDKALKPISTSDRIDIIREIKSEIIELQSEGVIEEQIIERLGNPKDLAKSYLGDLLADSKGISWKRFLVICAFYSVVGFSGMIIIPSLVIIAPTFIICGIITPILGTIKIMDYIFSLGIPYIENVRVVMGGLIEINPITEFFIAIAVGALLIWSGLASWKLLIKYCKKVSVTANKLLR